MARPAKYDSEGYPVVAMNFHRGSYQLYITVPKNLRPFLSDKIQLVLPLQTDDPQAANQRREAAENYLRHCLDVAETKRATVQKNLDQIITTYKELQYASF